MKRVSTFNFKDDAPGVVLIELITIFVSIVVSAFTDVLQRLLNTAIDIIKENKGKCFTKRVIVLLFIILMVF